MISKKMKYGIKALIEIVKAEEELISATTISQNGKIPLKFLEQILTELKKARLINSRKGSSGGYYLLKTPDNITMADIYRIIDGPIAWAPCASLNFYETCTDCKDERECQIHHALVHIRNHTLLLLQSMTLADMANNRYSFIEPIRE
jgi:Rrf2 family protein